jgi:hypothetical protein
VVVNGKRVKTIDVHSHCQFREIAPLLGAEASILTPPVNNAQAAFIEIDKRLKAMDGQGVDMEVLSINPFWYGKDRDLAAQIVKIQNENLAELCASKPDRFAAFCSLTLQAPDLAVQELEPRSRSRGCAARPSAGFLFATGGGMAGHVRFGARTGGALVILGLVLSIYLSQESVLKGLMMVASWPSDCDGGD